MAEQFANIPAPIRVDIKNINNKIGNVPSGKTAQGQIEDVDNKIGTVPSGKTVQGQIENVNSTLKSYGIPVPIQPTIIKDINVVNEGTAYATSACYDTFYIPVENGNTYNIQLTVTTSAVRYAFSSSVPANGVSCTFLLNQNTSGGNANYEYTAQSSGYLSVSMWYNSITSSNYTEKMHGEIDDMNTATSSDVGKALSPKTVENNKVTEWQFVEPGGSTENYVTKDLMQKCDLVEVPASANIWDKDSAQIGFLHKNGTVYTGGNYDNYVYGSIGEVNEGDVLKFYKLYTDYITTITVQFVVCYDSNGNVMPDAGTNSVTTFTVPSGVSSVSVTIFLSENPSGMVLKNNSSAPNSYIPYYEAYECYKATPEFIRDAIKGEIVLNVPSKVYAVVGIEMNIYFENITEDWTKYHWDVTCTKGKQMQRGYTITPVAGDVGEYTLKIRASIDEKAYNEVTTTLVVAAASSASGTSIIVLGDSTTDYGMAVTKIHTNFESASTTVQTLGTRGTSPNNHEGRSGWKASDYLTVQTRDGVSNPFYNPSSTTFDASYYFTNSGVSAPDWFFINLGINDVFGCENDVELNKWILRVLGYYDTIVDSLQTAEPSMKIGICITIPPNDSQDAFGKAYSCTQTRDRYKRNNTIWCKKLIEHFSDMESENVYLVPIHVNLDTVYNMGMETLPVNARNTSVTYESPIGNGGVHPVESGYWQIADVYTAFIKGNAST